MLSPEDVKVSSIEVAVVRPEQEDTRRLMFLENNDGVRSEGRYYIAKVYLERPLPVTAMAPDFYVDDEQIPKYGGFKGGIYFKVYDPRFFQRNAGKPLRFTLDGTTWHDTGVTLPRPEPVAPAALLGEGRAEEGDEGVGAAAATLPTKAEVLKQ